jgi:hypothetical protein
MAEYTVPRGSRTNSTKNGSTFSRPLTTNASAGSLEESTITRASVASASATYVLAKRSAYDRTAGLWPIADECANRQARSDDRRSGAAASCHRCIAAISVAPTTSGRTADHTSHAS